MEKNKIYRLSLLVFSIALLLFSACGTDKTAQEETAPSEPQAKRADAMLVSMNARQLEIAGIEVGLPQQRVIEDYIECTGMVGVPPENKVMVYAPVSAFVENVQLIEGRHVKKGQKLTSLTHPDMVRLQREFMEVQSQLDFLRGEYERKQTLAAEDATSERDMEEARANYKMATARYKGIKAELEMIGMNVSKLEENQEVQTSVPVYAPVSGYLTKVQINPGKLVSDQDLMFEILDNRHMHIELAVFSRDLPKIRKGQHIECIEPGSGDSYPAEVYLIGRSIHPETRTTNVHGHFEVEPLPLAPGTYMLARVRVFSEEVSAIPRSAMVQDGEQTYVFVQEDGAHYRKTPFKAGKLTEDWVEVKELDLPEGKKIVLDGAYYLNAGNDREDDH